MLTSYIPKGKIKKTKPQQSVLLNACWVGSLKVTKALEESTIIVTFVSSEYFQTSAIQFRIPLIGSMRSFLSNGVSTKC